MEVNFGLLCINPSLREDGEFIAEGIGIRGGWSLTLPSHHQGLASIIQMQFTDSESGPKTLGFHIIDLDGKDMAKFKDVCFEIEPPSPGDFYSVYTIDFDLSHIPFPRYGEYTMIFRVDEVDVHRMTYRLRSTTTSP